MAGYWLKSRSIKMQKRKSGQYLAILTELAWSIIDLLYGIKSTEKDDRCTCLLQNVFFKQINIFVFFVFILIGAFGFPVFWFHKDREITKNLFTLAESNFSERKLLCTCLNFGNILFAGTKRAVPGGQYRSSCLLE